MSIVNYTIKPFQSAADKSGGQRDQSTVHEPRGSERSTPAGYLTPAPMPAMKRLALDKGAMWCRILREAKPLLAMGQFSQSEVASMVGTSAPTLSRLLERFGKLSDQELTPERIAPIKDGGAASPFEPLLKIPEVVAEMHRLYAATMGASTAQATNDRRTGSMATTLLRLGDHPAVPAHLAEKLRNGAQPKCLLDFLRTSWTPEIEAKFRGQKHYNTATICGRRNLTEELEDGTIVPLEPGRVWVFDDMSSNIPFWFHVEPDSIAGISDRGLRQLVERHGCALGRQGLYAWDWASGAWLGLELVGRLRDAYQASDILRFIRKLVSIYGKPRKIIMERGTWQSRAISGWIVKELADEGIVCEIENGWTVPEVNADETARIQDGIRAIGVDIIHTHTPRGKPIEGAFNYHQRLVPTFFERGEVVNIGRHAGEFEWAAKAHLRGTKGVLHPRDLGFVYIDRLADVAWEAMQWEGWKEKSRREFVLADGRTAKCPLEILTNYLQTNPLPPVSQRDLAVFLPEKRNALIRGGVLTAQVNGDTHQFLNPEIFAALGDATRVDYAFDPAEPTLGAAVYNERGFLGWADYLSAGPVISARDRSGDDAVQLIKRYKLAHRTAARMLDFKTLRTVKSKEQRTGEWQSPVIISNDPRTHTSIPPSASNTSAVPVQRVRRSILSAPTKEEFASKRQRLAQQGARARELAELTT